MGFGSSQLIHSAPLKYGSSGRHGTPLPIGPEIDPLASGLLELAGRRSHSLVSLFHSKY